MQWRNTLWKNVYFFGTTKKSFLLQSWTPKHVFSFAKEIFFYPPVTSYAQLVCENWETKKHAFFYISLIVLIKTIFCNIVRIHCFSIDKKKIKNIVLRKLGKIQVFYYVQFYTFCDYISFILAGKAFCKHFYAIDRTPVVFKCTKINGFSIDCTSSKFTQTYLDNELLSFREKAKYVGSRCYARME